MLYASESGRHFERIKQSERDCVQWYSIQPHQFKLLFPVLTKHGSPSSPIHFPETINIFFYDYCCPDENCLDIRLKPPSATEQMLQPHKQTENNT